MPFLCMSLQAPRNRGQQVQPHVAVQVWYCIPPGQERKRFEQLARSIFPHDADKCKAFLRHKEFLVSPKTLRSHGIKFVQVEY